MSQMDPGTRKCPHMLGEPCMGAECELWEQRIVEDKNKESHVLGMCSYRWQTKILMESAQFTREVGGAIESFRNEMVAANAGVLIDGVQPRQKLKDVSNG